jgi:hypothetical protein
MEAAIQAEVIKFTKGETYDIKLVFDKPKIFTGGKYGNSTMYGGTMGTKDIRFYASVGLHEEIQAQNLRMNCLCKIKKITKPGEDYDIFTVNGRNHKHNVGDLGANNTLAPPENVELPNDLEARVKKLEDAVFNGENIPF